MDAPRGAAPPRRDAPRPARLRLSAGACTHGGIGAPRRQLSDGSEVIIHFYRNIQGDVS